MQESKTKDDQFYFNIMRMTPEKFKKLLIYIENNIQKIDTNMRTALSVCLKLEITFHFLANCDSFRSLSLLFLILVSNISYLVHQNIISDYYNFL